MDENDDITTWRALLREQMADHGETEDDIEGIACDGSLDAEFDSGHGLEEGCPFTIWTANRVYFPACYDGQEWVASVPRNPSGEATEHIGG